MNKDMAFSRRDFFKTAAAASATALLPGGLQGCSSQNTTTRRVRVAHEWDTLKEAIVGIPYVRLPQSIPPTLRKKLSPRWRSFLESSPGNTLEQAHPGFFHRVSREMNAASRILETRGVKVYHTRAMTAADEHYLSASFPSGGSQLYPRDPLLVVGPHVIETELAFPYRRRERFGIRRALAGVLDPAETPVIAMPPAMPWDGDDRMDDSPLLEGGDVLVLGRDIIVGISGHASNAAGIRWLAQLLGDAYRVHTVTISPSFLHLDCCLSTPRQGLAVLCREAFTNGLPDCLRNWDLIEVSPQEAGRFFACNALILDEKSLILCSGLPELSKRLRTAGQEVIETPFDNVAWFGGSLRCWHQALTRKGGM